MVEIKADVFITPPGDFYVERMRGFVNDIVPDCVPSTKHEIKILNGSSYYYYSEILIRLFFETLLLYIPGRH